MEIKVDDVDIYAFAGKTRSDKLTDIGDNKVTQEDGTIRIAVDTDTDDIEFDFAKFFEKNPKFKGKNFYITRDDIKKGDGSFVKGYGWVEVEPGNPNTRKYKKLGDEDNDKVQAMTRQEIEGLEAREGEVRMYFLKDGRCTTYIDASTGSNLEEGETRVTFRLHGHNGRVAQLKVLVNKA